MLNNTQDSLCHTSALILLKPISWIFFYNAYVDIFQHLLFGTGEEQKNM